MKPVKRKSPGVGPTPVAAAPPVTKPPVAVSTRRRGFRGLAMVGVPLLLLALVELALRLAGIGYSTAFFRAVRESTPAYLGENPCFTWRFFPRAQARFPEPIRLTQPKPESTCRIFIFGESAAMGDPDPAFGFGRVLEVLLADRFPETRFEVINLGITAINSHVVRAIAADCVPQQADFWLIYLGNNEVVGPYGAGTVFGAQAPGLGLIRTAIALKRLRLVQVMDSLTQRIILRNSPRREWGGMPMFAQQRIAPSDARLSRVHEYFRRNLRDILEYGRRSGAGILLSTVASNLKDCAPFASWPNGRLHETDRKRWQDLYQSGIAAQQQHNWQAALDAFAKAAELDDQFADLHFRLGQVFQSMERWDEARKHFLEARDTDALRFRPDSTINRIIRQEAEARVDQVDFVDGEQLVNQASPGQTAGQELLYEHVHLNFAGNYLLARAYAERLAERWGARHPPSAAAERPWLSAQECAQRLARTPWNEFQVLEDLLGRMQQAPFTSQLDHADRLAAHQRQMAALRPQTKPYALKLFAHEYRQALAHRTNDAVLWRSYARLQETAGDYPVATEAWRRVLAIWPHYAHGYLWLGEVFQRQGRDPEAQDCFRTALRLRPAFREAWHGLGRSLFRAGQAAQAVRCYEKSLAINPAQPDVHLDLGIALASLQQHPKARWHWEQTLQYQPDNPEAQRYLRDGPRGPAGP